jgi:hypothetical protein
MTPDINLMTIFYLINVYANLLTDDKVIDYW